MNKMQRFAFTSLAFSALLFISPSAFASEEEIGSELEPVSVEVDSYEPLYADVSEQHFAKAAIRFLSERGIVSGSTEGLFEPDAPLTRAQAAKILSETLNLTANQYRLQATDVLDSHWAIDSFKALEKAGIMTGTNGKLQPNAHVTRAQMASMLTRAFDYAGPTSFASFTDIDRDFWAYHDVNTLAANGVTTQVNQAFRPNEETTRAQFSLFVARSLDDRFKVYSSK